MGTGKSTIGRQLARQTGKEFFDSDQEIEARTGADIALIFEIEGEQGFRGRESKMIEELTSLKNIVLATGGGAILLEQNRRCLEQNGIIIYLRSSIETILQRTQKDKKRPLLQGDDRHEKIKQILEQRSLIYENLAQYIFDTDQYSIKEMVNEMINKLGITCDS